MQITVHEDKITAITFHGENLEQITDHENTPCIPLCHYIPEKRKFSGILCFRQQRSRRTAVRRRCVSI